MELRFVLYKRAVLQKIKFLAFFSHTPSRIFCVSVAALIPFSQMYFILTVQKIDYKQPVSAPYFLTNSQLLGSVECIDTIILLHLYTS